MLEKIGAEKLAELIQNEIQASVNSFVGQNITKDTKPQIFQTVKGILTKYKLEDKIKFNLFRDFDDSFVVYFYGPDEIPSENMH